MTAANVDQMTCGLRTSDHRLSSKARHGRGGTVEEAERL